MTDNERERNEGLGRAVAGVSWFLFAAKFIVVTTVLALVVLYFAGKPLWIAPIAAVAVFTLYKIVLRLIWKLIEGISDRE
ncbi:MAG: hypothetical protein K6F34_02190 [Lachnospiraceae bacterium]|nr:hypothetical protein [Lachnospiraceae bacterium]